jgi:endo-1,4-beta-mannosidase
MTSSKVNRRRFLKYAGAASAVVGASALGLDLLHTRPPSGNQSTTSTPSTLASQKTALSTTWTTYSSTTRTPYSSPKDNFVAIEKGGFVHKGRAFTLKGFNYFPQDHPWRIFNEWDGAEADHELQLGADLNANCVRTAINYQFSTNNVYYEYSWQDHFHVDQSYLDSVESFLTLTDKHKLKVILTLFDYVYWELINPSNYWVGEKYLQELIPRFADDARILGWDVVNEPDFGHFPHAGVENTVGFLRAMTNKIKQLDKNHPTTIGLGKASNTPKIQDFTDFLSIHYYGPAEELPYEIAPLAQFDKPIVLEEYGKHTWSKRPGDPSNEGLQRDHYLSTLGVIQGRKMRNFGGELFWCLLDFPVLNDPLESPLKGEEIFENHMGVFRLDYEPKPAAEVVRHYYAIQT